MNIIRYIITAIVLALGFGSCMPLQDSYDYEPKNIDNNIYMSTWEFIETQQGAFSYLKRAIIHSGISQELYKQTDRKYTYLLLTNDAFGGSGGILAANGAASVEAMNPETLKNILLYHIVNGYYHGLGTLSFDAVNVITMFNSPDAIMTMKLNNRNSLEQYSRLVINDMAGSSIPITAAVSNIVATNGVVHILKSQVTYKP